MFRKLQIVLFCALVLALLVAPTAAQDSSENVIAAGLNSPRGIAYDADGNLYVTEAGAGGDTVLLLQEDAQITAGLTGQVLKIEPDGTTSVAIPALTSVSNPAEGGASLGAYRAIPTDDSIWVVLSDAQNLTVFSDAVMEIDKSSLRVKHYIDLHSYEVENNPDGRDEVYSNPSDVGIAQDGTIYIVDTGANTLYTWSEADGLSVVHSWNNTVPTSIDFGPDGSIYIGFLGEALAPGAGKVEHWSADGKTLLESFGGLTTVTDVLVTDDGSLYAVQLVTEFTDEGLNPNSGNVVKITSDGATPIAEGLLAPFGLAQAPDGNFAVSIGSAFSPPGAGGVIRIPMGG